ncbi:MAG: hypothetical protein LBF60_02750, partial [Treponema sp.]|nr:hypothetical protein [Treponema sp.]
MQRCGGGEFKKAAVFLFRQPRRDKKRSAECAASPLALNNKMHYIIPMVEATGVQRDTLQKIAQKDAAGETAVHNADISADDTKEIEAQIAELALKNRIILKDDMGKPLKKEMLFPIVANLLLFGAAAVILFFLARYFNRQENAIGRSAAFSSVEGELINQLREDSENIISGKEQEITAIRQELNDLELRRQQELANFDAQLESREAAVLDQLRRDREAEQTRLAAQGLNQAEINERLRNFGQDRIEQYQRQFAEERNAILNDFEQRELQYHDSIRALNDERRIVQTEIQRQQEFYLQMREENAAGSHKLEQALADMQRMRDVQQRIANEEALIVGMFNKIQSDFQSRQFEDAIASANSLTRVLQDMQGSSERRAVDIALAASLARMARLELDYQTLQNAHAASVASDALAATERQQQAALRIAELQTALDEANRLATEHEAALHAENQRAVAEREQLESQYARNLASAVGGVRQAKRFADNNDAAAAMNAYRQAAGYFGLSAAETDVFTSGIETLSQNALVDAVAKQRLESDELLNQTESAMRNRIVTLDAALANLRKSDRDKQARISQLEAENARLLQQSQQLTSGAANQSATASQLQARVTQLEAENARLHQQNQQLTSGVANQSAAASQLQARVTQLETENSRLLQQNRQVTNGAANQSAAGAPATSQLQARVTQLETENSRLFQQYLQKTKSAANHSAAGASATSQLRARVTR